MVYNLLSEYKNNELTITMYILWTICRSKLITIDLKIRYVENPYLKTIKIINIINKSMCALPYTSLTSTYQIF